MPNKWSQDEALVVLFARIFHDHFCPEQQISREQKPTVLAAFFLGWCAQHMPMLDATAICESAEVDFSIWEAAVLMVNDPLGPERLFGVWPNISYSDRPVPQHKLKKMIWTLLLEYDDGRIMPIQMHCTKEMVPDQTFRDSTVAFLLHKNFNQAFVNQIAEHGLDGLYEYGGDYGEEIFNVLMGAFLQIIPQLKPELHARLKDWMRLIQGTFQPVLSPEQRAALDSQRRKAQPSSPLGGWD